MLKKEVFKIIVQTALIATVFPFLLVIILPALLGENIFFLSESYTPEFRDTVVFRQTLWLTAWCYSFLYFLASLFSVYFKVTKNEIS